MTKTLDYNKQANDATEAIASMQDTLNRVAQIASYATIGHETNCTCDGCEIRRIVRGF